VALAHDAAGAFVKAMDAVVERRFAAIESVVMTVLDPATCPLELLPWLARSSGLLHFSSGWPESTQRAAIASARQVLRLRGTPPGVDLAVASYGSSVELVEWFDDLGADVGTWRIVLGEGSDPGIDPIAQEEILAALKRIRPLSRPFTLSIGGSAFADADVSVVGRLALYEHFRVDTSDGVGTPNHLVTDTGDTLVTDTGDTLVWA
jgi:phage tail P2-like protein